MKSFVGDRRVVKSFIRVKLLRTKRAKDEMSSKTQTGRTQSSATILVNGTGQLPRLRFM
jgi:hypothetical protein